MGAVAGPRRVARLIVLVALLLVDDKDSRFCLLYCDGIAPVDGFINHLYLGEVGVVLAHAGGGDSDRLNWNVVHSLEDELANSLASGHLNRVLREDERTALVGDEGAEP